MTSTYEYKTANPYLTKAGKNETFFDLNTSEIEKAIIRANSFPHQIIAGVDHINFTEVTKKSHQRSKEMCNKLTDSNIPNSNKLFSETAQMKELKN